MVTLLFLAAFLALTTGLAHSVLGERYLLRRFLRRHDLPPLFGGTKFTARTLRFAWHLTTLAWWGFAAILVLLARQSFSFQNLSWVLALTFLASGSLTVVVSRGQHLAWVAFFVIAVICLYAAA